MTTSCASELCAVVTRTNGNGFQVEGRDGWLNLSKFASVALPAVGQRVRIGLDKSGYVREIAPDTAPAAPESMSAPGSAPDTLRRSPNRRLAGRHGDRGAAAGPDDA